MVFLVVIYGRESWTIKTAEHLKIDVFDSCIEEDSWKSLGQQGDQISHSKGNQSWIFTERTDTESPILWALNAKNWLIRKYPDAGKVWRQGEKGTTEDELVGWHHGPNGHEFEQALGVVDRQGSLVWCSPWGHKESDKTEWLNWNGGYMY